MVFFFFLLKGARISRVNLVLWTLGRSHYVDYTCFAKSSLYRVVKEVEEQHCRLCKMTLWSLCSVSCIFFLRFRWCCCALEVQSYTFCRDAPDCIFKPRLKVWAFFSSVTAPGAKFCFSKRSDAVFVMIILLRIKAVREFPFRTFGVLCACCVC